MQIKKIFLYSVPYTEDDHHQPLHSNLPTNWTPIKEFDDIKSDIDKFGKVISLTTIYDEIKNANYMQLIVLINNAEENYYAWIDNIVLNSQIDGGSTFVYYHWDYWRICIDKIKPLRGVIVQRKELSFNPPQLVPRIIESYKSTTHDIINQNKNIAWVYLVATEPRVESSDNNQGQGILRYAFPIHRLKYNSKFFLKNALGQYVQAPSFKELINGSVFNDMNIDQAKLIGCCVSSIAPMNYTLGESNHIEIDYQYSGDEVSIYCTDLIENYGNPIQTYDNIHAYRFTTWDLGTSGFLNELKWWCFPTNETTFVYDVDYLTHVSFTITLRPAENQYYPFLQYLKYYSSYYDILKEIIINTSNFNVRYGSYYWENTSSRNVFQQVFSNISDKIIKKIIVREDEDRFNIIFEDNTTMENIGIDNIFVERSVEIPFVFNVITEDNVEILPKLLGSDNIVIENVNGVWPLQNHTFEKPLCSTPLNNLYLLDNSGYPVNKFEQGRDLLNYTVQAVSQNSQMFVLYKFNKGSYVDNTEFVVNMTPVDLSQEYINEYVLSGERNAANERRVENIVSSLTNLAANAAIGTLIAGPGGGIFGGLKSFGKTLLGGAVTTGLVGGALGYYQQSELENRLYNRGSLLIREGADYSWLSNGYSMSLVTTKIDEYSENEYKNKVHEFGIECNEIDNNGSSIIKLLSEEGPIRLSSVTLDKDIPYKANVYIREKLFNGVYLDPSLSGLPNVPTLLNNNN